jgi:tripartite-type tricarboxylate transporter receptor subunit TctC
MKKILVAMLLIPTLAFAWEPTKPINVMIGSGPGSAIEMNFRLVASEVEKRDKNVNFIINLKPGADSTVMLNDLVKQKADGHTIGAVAHMSIFVTHEIWQKDVMNYTYESFKTPFMIAKSPLVIVARSNSDVNTPKQLVDTLKKPNNPVSIAIGGGAHKITYEYIMTKISGDTKNVQTIRYPGPLQAVTAVAAKEVEFGIMPLSTAIALIKSGKVKPIALTTESKHPSMPDVPTMAQQVPGLNAFAGVLLAFPKDTPDNIVEWYRKKFSDVINSDDMKSRYSENYLYYNKQELTQVGMDKFIKDLRNQWLPLARTIQD